MWLFLSHPFGPSCPAYGGGERIQMSHASSICGGDSCNKLDFTASNHIGTHFDFPRHFDDNGKTIDDYGASEFFYKHVGVAWLEAPQGHLVSIADIDHSLSLTSAPDQLELLFIRTGTASYRDQSTFWSHGPGIASGVAEWLRQEFPKLRAIGLDTISISSFQSRQVGRQVHKEFLAHPRPILIIEDAHLEPLDGLPPAEVLAAPLRLETADGAPCTIFARKIEA